MAKSNEDFEAQYRDALHRGQEKLKAEPRAEAAYYDKSSGRIVIELVNGCTFVFPPKLAQGLSEASSEDLSEIRILSQGLALDWPRLDVQFSVAGLMAGAFGSRQWMAGIDKQSGKAKLSRKSRPAAESDKKGGRPTGRKTA